jgi:hypothetical protein
VGAAFSSSTVTSSRTILVKASGTTISEVDDWSSGTRILLAMVGLSSLSESGDGPSVGRVNPA